MHRIITVFAGKMLQFLQRTPMPPLRKSTAKVSTAIGKKPRKPMRTLKVVPGAEGKNKRRYQYTLKRVQGNPIIRPSMANHWESKATFNPAAFLDGETVHIVYRAIGDNDVSVMGYASSKDGVTIHERLPHPVYAWKEGEETKKPAAMPASIVYSSGGGWNGGCEDPRLTLIDDTVYMLYTAFNGWNSLRIALTSIKLDDLKNKKWNWKKPVFISPPGELNKNWVLFPEKISGKYAVLHSVSPEVLVDYFDSLDNFDGTKYIASAHGKGLNKKRWDSAVRGAGPPPIKTKYGWLVLYHAIDHRDPDRYKLGAMLLDLNNPKKVIARARKPILEPDEYYENSGFKSGVIYACGAVVVDNQLLVYYGGADTVTCLAAADFDDFIKKLRADKEPKLKPKKNIKATKSNVRV